ncbi:dihydropteroate synthase [Microbacterium sp. C7(2022)]|uniref:dihydropteroate synthase n=1 Tax=Microbacterium sp. C7(2022) TaxID=2992759 RepID=UPI00237B8708|nr:dihydropteroate synthase [Microbacterium sp. C7(2022)]MDE0545178.1 dihydropteroate synthase [Microbacterium sp. C7(2022)]
MTLIMGVVNVTTDSFSDGGRYLEADAATAHGRALFADGAHILDIGGESTRPGADRVPPDVEQARVVPVIAGLRREVPGAILSVDTMNASTARAAVEAGANIVNDVSGGLSDPDMLAAVAETAAEIVLGHWRGPSSEMYARADYDDVAAEVVGELRERADAALSAGIAADRIILDPGIGFGKRGEQNWQALRATPALVGTGFRVLIGTSRKRFFADALGPDPDIARRDLATAVTSVLAAQAGAWAVRVHDVAATRDAIGVWNHWDGSATQGGTP